MLKTPKGEVELDKGPAFDIHVVLVRPLYESNIGAASRAMANMGAKRLILVAPQCEVGEVAQKAAATGQTALQQRSVYPDWQSYHARESGGIRIAFTARTGRSRDVRDFAEVLGWLHSEHELFQNPGARFPVYLIFGPEDWGLSTEDLELAHFACSIPTFGDNWSLNLAQAVLLALYTLRLKWGPDNPSTPEARPPTAPATIFPEETLRTWIQEMGFQIDHSKVNAFAILRRMILHNVPSDKELSILEIVLQQSIRKLREYNEWRAQLKK